MLVSPRIPCSPNSHSSPAITMRPYCLTLSAADVLRQTICVTFRVCLSQQDFSQGFTLQSWVVLRLFGPLQRCRIKRCLSMKLLGLHGPSPVGAGDMKCKIQKSLQKSQTQRFSVWFNSWRRPTTKAHTRIACLNHWAGYSAWQAQQLFLQSRSNVRVEVQKQSCLRQFLQLGWRPLQKLSLLEAIYFFFCAPCS